MSTKRSNTDCTDATGEKEFNVLLILLPSVGVLWAGRCTYLNVNILFGGRLEEFHAQLIGQLLAALERNDAFIFHVAFVADQYHLGVVPRVRLDLCYPADKERQNTKP